MLMIYNVNSPISHVGYISIQHSKSDTFTTPLMSYNLDCHMQSFVHTPTCALGRAIYISFLCFLMLLYLFFLQGPFMTLLNNRYQLHVPWKMEPGTSRKYIMWIKFVRKMLIEFTLDNAWFQMQASSVQLFVRLVTVSIRLASTLNNMAATCKQTSPNLYLTVSIILIAVFCVCVCVCACVRVSVISEIEGMGGRSSTLLAPTWRASPGELQPLLLELTRRMVREKKPLEVLRR